jgi:hypothetical protein
VPNVHLPLLPAYLIWELKACWHLQVLWVVGAAFNALTKSLAAIAAFLSGGAALIAGRTPLLLAGTTIYQCSCCRLTGDSFLLQLLHWQYWPC